MEFIRKKLRFKTYIVDRLFKLVSVLRNEPFSSCKFESTEIASKKMVDKSVDPHETPLGVTNSDSNVNLIDNKVDQVSSYSLLLYNNDNSHLGAMKMNFL